MDGMHFIYCDEEEAQLMASVDRDILDYLPTDVKYTSEMDEVLNIEYGEGLLLPEMEQRYKLLSLMSEEELLTLEAEAILYHASLGNAYPEARGYSKKLTKF